MICLLADQRENRLYLRELAHGRTVLDLCCYTGGFALNAAYGSAKHVTGAPVDARFRAVTPGILKLFLVGLDTLLLPRVLLEHYGAAVVRALA